MLILNFSMTDKLEFLALVNQFPGLEVGIRSKDNVPRPNTAIFIVDTMVSSIQYLLCRDRL